MIKCHILRKLTPWGTAHVTHKGSRTLFALSNSFQIGMTQPGSTNGHRADRLHGKGIDPGQVLPSGDWAVVLPTQ